jgi:hypothetical protein
MGDIVWVCIINAAMVILMKLWASLENRQLRKEVKEIHSATNGLLTQARMDAGKLGEAKGEAAGIEKERARDSAKPSTPPHD